MDRLEEAGTEAEDNADQRNASGQVVDCQPVDIVVITKQDDAPDDEGADREDYCQPKTPLR